MGTELSGLGLNQSLLEQTTKKGSKDRVPKETRDFDSMEKALENANSDSGDEAILTVKDEATGKDKFIVVDIQKNVKAEDLINPASFSFKSALIARDNKKIEIVEPQKDDLEAEIHGIKELSDIARDETASGLSLKKTDGTNDYGQVPSYISNQATVAAKIIKVEEKIKTKLSVIEKELENLKNEKPSLPSFIASKEKEISDLKIKLNELSTNKVITQAKLLVSAPTNLKVPGTELNTGAKRNNPEAVVADLLRVRLGELQSRFSIETDPVNKDSIKKQIDELGTEVVNLKTKAVDLQEAQLHIDIRVGALASMNKSLSDTKTKLEIKVYELEKLETKLEANPKDGTVKAKVEKLQNEIETLRTALISGMENDLSVFKKHASMINVPDGKGGYKKEFKGGAKDAVELLELQIQKLKDLKPAAGQVVDGKSVLTTVDETRKKLLEKVKDAGSKWKGIGPEEAKLIEGVVTNTNKIVVNYKEAEEKLKTLQPKAELAKKTANFEIGLYLLDPDKNPDDVSAMVDLAMSTEDNGLKNQLLLALPASPVTNASIDQFIKLHSEEVTKLFKNAKEGSKLAELKNSYIALQMSKEGKYKDNVDLDKLDEKLAELNKDPEIIKALEEAKQTALKAQFGDPAKEGKKLVDYLSGEGYAQRLKLLSSEAQKESIKQELAKLTLLAPESVEEVSKRIMIGQVFVNGPNILEGIIMNTPEGKDFAKDLAKSGKKITKVTNALDKALRQVAEIPDNKRLDSLISILKKTEDLDPVEASRTIKLLTDLKSNGKMGAIDGLFAAATLLSKGIPKNINDGLSSASSLASLIGKSDDIASYSKSLGIIKGVTKDGNWDKAFKALKWLGPVADGISSVLDYQSGAKAFQAGDIGDGIGKTVSSAGGLTAAAGGSMILLEASAGLAATGIGVPLAIAGAVIAIAGFGISAIWGESDEEKALKALGVWKDSPPSQPFDPDGYMDV